MPPPPAGDADARDVVEAMLAYRDRRKRTLGGKPLRDFIDEGRRF
jgi:hypothetical protein